jgi:hypothetical protein
VEISSGSNEGSKSSELPGKLKRALEKQLLRGVEEFQE